MSAQFVRHRRQRGRRDLLVIDALEARLIGPKKIALFGHRDVGKTTLLAMFYRQAAGGQQSPAQDRGGCVGRGRRRLRHRGDRHRAARLDDGDPALDRRHRGRGGRRPAGGPVGITL